MVLSFCLSAVINFWQYIIGSLLDQSQYCIVFSFVLFPLNSLSILLLWNGIVQSNPLWDILSSVSIWCPKMKVKDHKTDLPLPRPLMLLMPGIGPTHKNTCTHAFKPQYSSIYARVAQSFFWRAFKLNSGCRSQFHCNFLLFPYN